MEIFRTHKLMFCIFCLYFVFSVLYLYFPVLRRTYNGFLVVRANGVVEEGDFSRNHALTSYTLVVQVGD